MELRHLRYFVVVAEELNLTRAAVRLHTVRPSLARQIYQLEEYLGVSLLNRQRHRLELTDAGRTLLNDARRLLQDVDFIFDRVQHAANMEAGRLTVGFFTAAEWRIFPRLLPFLRSRFPELQLLLRSLTPPEQIAALQNHTINVGFVRGPILDAELSSEVIVSDPIVVVLPVQHPLAKLRRVPLQSLATLPLVRLKREVAPGLYDILHCLASDAGVKFHPTLETEDMLGTLTAVSAGQGFSLLPKFVEWIPKTVVCRQLALATAPKIDLLVTYRKGDVHPVLIRFLALLRECFLSTP